MHEHRILMTLSQLFRYRLVCKSALAILAAIAVSISPLYAQIQTPDQGPSSTVPGWIKSFAEAASPGDGARIVIPSKYETALEQDVRKAIIAVLTQRGYEIAERDEQEGEYALSYHAEVTKGKPRRFGQAVVGIGPADIVNRGPEFGNIPPNDAVAPRIVFNRDRGADPTNPYLSVRILVRQQGMPVWTAHGGAEIHGGTRSAIARGAVSEMISHFGQSTDAPDAQFPVLASARTIIIPDASTSQP